MRAIVSRKPLHCEKCMPLGTLKKSKDWIHEVRRQQHFLVLPMCRPSINAFNTLPIYLHTGPLKYIPLNGETDPDKSTNLLGHIAPEKDLRQV